MAESFIINYDTKKQYRTNDGLELFWMLKKFSKNKICVYTDKIAYKEDLGYLCELPIVEDDYLVESLFLFRDMHLSNPDALREVIATIGEVQWSFESMNRDVALGVDKNVFAESSGILKNSQGVILPWYILGDCCIFPSLEDYEIPDVTDERFMKRILDSYECNKGFYYLAGEVGMMISYLKGKHFGLLGGYVKDVQNTKDLEDFIKTDASQLNNPLDKMNLLTALKHARYMLQMRKLLKKSNS